MEKSFEVNEEVLALINGYSVKELTADEVFCFSVILCDNDIDRDNERFSLDSLKSLAELFKGRTGIFNHDPNAEKQTARIFDTAVLAYPDRQTADGMPYYGLTGYAYMVRTEENKGLISEIEGGIKKEVSISCQVSRRVCSVCGADQNVSPCMHSKGNVYGDKVCFVTLEEPKDAYEWSFVAIPAQRNAGVIKKFSEAEKKSAGREEKLREDIIRLAYFSKDCKDTDSLKEKLKDMDEDGLYAFKAKLEAEVCSKEKKDYTKQMQANDACYKL